MHRARELRPVKWLELLSATDALRRPQRLEEVIAVCECDALSRPGAPSTYAPGELARQAYETVRGVDAGAVATAVLSRAAKHGAPAGSDAIAKAIRSARIAALRQWKAALEARAAQAQASEPADAAVPARRDTPPHA
jgi:tRNA nucleotidyltransferase (CCA-adding enzyme)